MARNPLAPGPLPSLPVFLSQGGLQPSSHQQTSSIAPSGLPRGLLRSAGFPATSGGFSMSYYVPGPPPLPPPKTRLDVPDMNIPSLPIELVDAITHAVAQGSLYETAALRAMSLVCRSWLPVIHGQLFTRLWIRDINFLKLVDFLDEGDNALSAHVQALHIFTARREEDEGIPVSNLPLLLAKLPRLRAFEMSGFPFQKSDIGESRFQLDRVSITFEPTAEGRVVDLLAFLDVFSEIDELDLHSVLWGEEIYFVGGSVSNYVKSFVSGLQVGALPQVKVKKLHLGGAEDYDIAPMVVLELLRRSPSGRSLTSIKSSGESLDHFVLLGELLQEAGDSLLELDINIGEDLGDYYPIWQKNERSISACTSLQKLKLSVYVLDGTVDDSASSRWSRLVALLTHVPPSLVELHLTLQGHAENFMLGFSAAERRLHLDKVLGAFPNLSSVVVQLSFLDYTKGYGQAEEGLLRSVEDAVRQALLETTARGVLKLVKRSA